MSSSTLKVSELDFNNIKSNLKEYLRSQDEFTDYDFDGSAMSTLIDLLSYVTHYNAVNANFAVNETFLDTAKIRSNVVSHAKLLGYTPRSATAPMATINLQIDLISIVTLTVNGISYTEGNQFTIEGLRIIFSDSFIPALSSTISASYILNDQQYTQTFDGDGVKKTFTITNGVSNIGNITIVRGTKFSTVVDDENYTFVTDKTIEISASENYSFNGDKALNIYEGDYQTISYTYDSASDTKFVIPDQNIVTSSMIVNVQESNTNTFVSAYTRAQNITEITEESKVYFIDENKDGYYEIYFGDGIIGYKPIDGNIITIEYIVTNGSVANGSSEFSLIDSFTSSKGKTYNEVTINTISVSSGGADKENIESIRYNAPLTFIAQNRAVTAEDYKSLILGNFADIEAITVWGGELNDPPVYGKVFISIKPKSVDVLSDGQKQSIIDVIEPKSVVTITPEFVDPDITNLFLEVFFKYNPNITSYSADDLEVLVRNTLSNYNELQIKQFGSVLRYSNMLNLIDQTDSSIINSFVRLYMSKNLIPTIGLNQRYDIYFAAPIYNTVSNESIISSSKFTFSGTPSCELKDTLTTSGTRIIQVIAINDLGETIIKDSNAGSVNIDSGIVTLNNFSVSGYEGSAIEIRVIPDSYDIAAKRNQLLNILVDESTITGEIDTIVTGGTTAGVNYRTTPRHND